MNNFFLTILSIFIILFFLLSLYQILTNNETEPYSNILKLDMTRSEKGVPITEAIINIKK